jgi:O-antigen/teichoic acid export membrane protein
MTRSPDSARPTLYRFLPDRVSLALVEGLGDGRDLDRSALLALAIRIAAAGLGYGTHVILAQVLGASEYGIYSYLWVWIMIGGFLASAGLSEAAVRFIAEYRDTGRGETARAFIRTGLATVSALSGTIAAAGLLILYLMADQLPSGYLLPIMLALACLPVLAIQDLLEGYALAFSWTGLAHVPPYVLRQVLIIVFLLVAVSAAMPATAATGLLAVLAAGICATLLQLLVFLRRMRKVLPAAVGPRHSRLWVSTALPMMMTNGLQLILTFSDIIVLGMFVDSELVALYFAATRVSSQVTAVQFAVTSAVAQRMAGLNASKSRRELTTLIRRSTHWIFWPTLAVTAGVIALGWPLLRLFGAEFTAAYPVLIILALGLLARASTGGAEEALKMLGHERSEFGAKAVSTAVNLGLNLGLIPIFGIYGAAVATATSMAVYALLLEILMRRLVASSSFVATLRD